MRVRRSLLALTLALAPTVSLVSPASTAAAPEGRVTFALHVTLAPTWFDPAETPGVITPFLTLYALHDGLVYVSPYEDLKLKGR